MPKTIIKKSAATGHKKLKPTSTKLSTSSVKVSVKAKKSPAKVIKAKKPAVSSRPKLRSVKEEELEEMIDEDDEVGEDEESEEDDEDVDDEAEDDLADEDIRLTPKIRITKVNKNPGKLSQSPKRPVFGSNFVVDPKNKRSSYVEDDADLPEFAEDEGEVEDEEELEVVVKNTATPKTKKLTEMEEITEDDSMMDIEPSAGPDELADLLPPDEQLSISEPALAESEAKITKTKAEDEEKAQKDDLHKAHNITIYKRIALGFSVLVFLVLIGVLYFTMVKATVTVSLQEQTISEQTGIQVYDRPQDFSLPVKSIRGLVKLVSVEQSKLYQVSGHDVIGEEVVGQITLYNKYNKSQPLVASTRLLSASGKLYRLKNSVTVPAGGQVLADVYADEAKPESAVGAELFTVPGLWEGLQDKIYGQSTAGAIKYQQKLRRIVSQDDIDKAMIDIKQILQDKVKADFDNTYNDYDYKIYQLDEATLKFAVSGKVGEEKDQLPVSMSGTVEVVAFNNSQAQEIAKLSSAAKLPAGQDLLTIDTNSLKYELVKFDPNMVMAELSLNYDVKARANSKNDIVDKNKIIGLSEDQLRQYLSNNKDIRTYNIEFYPAFIKQVPRLTDRIEVKVVE